MSNNDFDKTVPNIPSVFNDDEPNEWEKTSNNKYSPQPNADDWGKTQQNYVIPQDDEPDFNKTYLPANQAPKVPDWGITQGNIDVPRDDDFGGDKRGGGNDNFMTTPLIRLPEAERLKYQNLPPTPTEEKAQQQEEDKKKGGIPAWLWVSGGILGMSFFAALALLLGWYFFLQKTGFEVTLTSIPPGSRILVNKKDWGVTVDESGKRVLSNLETNEPKTFEIVNPGWECKKIENIVGKDGESRSFRAECAEKQVVVKDECKGRTFKKGEEAAAQKCAEEALGKMTEPIDPDELARILSMYIIQFDSGKFDIPAKNKEFLQKASVVMKKLKPGTVLEIGGHTDDRGSDADNQKLSDNRAKAVRDVLVNEFTVPSDMLTEKGYGESQPKAKNDTDDGRFTNRRIEYKVIKKG